MPGLRIWPGWVYTRVTEGCEYALIMPEYVGICLNSAEYASVCQDSE